MFPIYFVLLANLKFTKSDELLGVFILFDVLETIVFIKLNKLQEVFFITQNLSLQIKNHSLIDLCVFKL